MKVNIKSVYHYFLIYLLISWYSTGFVFGVIGTDSFEYLILFVCAAVILINRRFWKKSLLYFCLALLLDIVLVRFTSGGIGLGYYLHILSAILIAFVAYLYNDKQFVHRFVRCVYFFSVISLLIWVLSLVVPELIQRMTVFSYVPYYIRTYTSSVDYTLSPVTYHGALLYVLRTGNDLQRNNGIFSEPGLYQMVLNIALYFVLFFSEKIYLDNKKKKRIAIILILTVISTQSTTGYLSLAVLLLIYSISLSYEKKTKIPVKRILLFGVMLFELDIIINGAESFFSKTIGSKIVFEGGKLLISGSGSYRVDTFAIAINSILSHPFGVGNDIFSQILSFAGKTSSDGAALMAFGAQLGVQVWFILIWFFVRPAYRNRKTLLTFLTVVFMYVNTTLGQSDIFYPVLLILAFNYKSKEEMRVDTDENIVDV